MGGLGELQGMGVFGGCRRRGLNGWNYEEYKKKILSLYLFFFYFVLIFREEKCVGE